MTKDNPARRPRQPVVALIIMTVVFSAAVVSAARAAPPVQDEISGSRRTYAGPRIDKNGIVPPVVNIDDLQNAWRSKCLAGGGSSNPVVTWSYDPGVVRCLRLRTMMYTTIVFPAWESIENTFLGDPDAFSVSVPAGQPNIVLVRPSADAVGADTQLTIVGRAEKGETKRKGARERNIYSFYLYSTGVKSKRLPNVTVKINSPGPGTSSATTCWGCRARQKGTRRTSPAAKGPPAAKKKTDYLRSIPFDPGKLKFEDYLILVRDPAAESIAPVRVFDDGVFTYFDFGENGRSDRVKQVVVFQVVDGVDSRVNTRTIGTDGNILVAEAIGNFTLRNGKRVVCVRLKNKGQIDAGGKESGDVKTAWWKWKGSDPNVLNEGDEDVFTAE